MKIKKICVLIVVFIMISALPCLAACGGDEENYNNVECSVATIIYDGEQTVTLTSHTPIGEGEAALFKDSISASDIILKDALAGKTVSAVNYIDETEITITLSGTATKTPTGDSIADIGRIYVSSNALKTKGSGFCAVTVIKSELRFKSFSSTLNVIEETFTLIGGTFTENADKLIALKEGESGTLKVTVSGTDITFTVTDCSTQTVYVVVPAEATTTGVEYSLELGFNTSIAE